MESNDSFEYTYSAPEQEEVKRIREKYLPREERESKLEQLRRLDASVTRKGNCAAIVLGVVGALVMGVGMCCCMVWTGLMIPGIIIGVIGMAGVGAAYPVYTRITQKERERLAPQILKLTEELMR